MKNNYEVLPTRSNEIKVTHIEHRKFRQDGTQLLLERVLGEFDFTHIKVPYPADFEVFMDDLDERSVVKILQLESRMEGHTVGVFRWVFERTMSRKSAAVGTGAMALSPLVDMMDYDRQSIADTRGDEGNLNELRTTLG